MLRGLTIFLIPALLVSQSFVAVSHSHEGTLMVQPEDHSSRPHVHLCGTHSDHDLKSQHSHQGDQQDPGAAVVADLEHDADAIDVDATSSMSREIRAQKLIWPLILSPFDSGLGLTSSLDGGSRQFDNALNMQRPKCALFLRMLSIRC